MISVLLMGGAMASRGSAQVAVPRGLQFARHAPQWLHDGHVVKREFAGERAFAICMLKV